MTTHPRARLRTRLALILALGLVAVVTLPPSGGATYGRIDLCLVCGGNGAASGLLNIVLYLPLGAALWRATRRLGAAVALGAAVSLAVELLQLAIPGRHTALSDLLANTLGASLGALLAIAPRRWLLPEGRDARIAAGAAALAACASFALAGALFAPVAPGGTFYAQWEPRGGMGRTYDGRVLAASLGARALPALRQDDSDGVRAAIERGEPVAVRFVVGTPQEVLTPVFRLVAGKYDDGDEGLQVGVHRDALVLTPRFRADDFRLSRPEVQVEGALAAAVAGDTMTVVLQPRADGHDVTVDGRTTHVAFTVARGWALLYATFIRSARTLRAMELLWMLGLGALVAWFARTTPQRAASLGACLAVAAAVPMVSHLAATPVREYLAFAGGAALATLLRGAAGRLSAASGPTPPGGAR